MTRDATIAMLAERLANGDDIGKRRSLFDVTGDKTMAAINGAMQDLREHNDTMDVIHAARDSFAANEHLIPQGMDDVAIRMLWQLAFTAGAQFGMDHWAESLKRLGAKL